MSEQRREEKEEKEEKREEKEEKTAEEKWRRDPLSAIVWAAIFIWAGAVLLVDNLRLLDNLWPFAERRLEAWPLIFFGAGVIVLLEVAARLVMPEYRRGVTGSLVFGVILIAIGLGGWVGWDVVWPLVLIAIGASMLLGGFLRKR